MRDEDLEALRQGYEALNRGEEAAFDLLAPDIEWQPGAYTPEAGRFTGREGFVGFVASWHESFDEFRLEPQEMTVVGDQVIVLLRQSGRGRGSGVELDITTVHVWTIRDGVAVAWAAYPNRPEALAAIGASP
jgi:ketosteroid isomerase-like protein